MLCEGGCPASKVAKFEDFRRLVVVVLQWSRCVGGFFGKNGFRRSVVGEFSGFLLVSSPGGVHKGEGGLWVCSGWPPLVSSPQVWFCSLLCWVLLSFRCPWQKP